VAIDINYWYFLYAKNKYDIFLLFVN